MRFGKLIISLLAASLFTGCACRTAKVDSASENIPSAAAGSELKDVNFGFDSYELSPAAKSILSANAAWLKANPTAKAQVEGHCDERGTNEYNMVLGSHRARAAFDYLRSLGVEASRLSTVSYGEELPLDPAHNEEAWAKNRRDHFNVQK